MSFVLGHLLRCTMQRDGMQSQVFMHKLWRLRALQSEMTVSHEAQAHGRTRAQPVARAADAGGFILISRTTTQFLNVGVSRQRKKKDLDNRGTITKSYF